MQLWFWSALLGAFFAGVSNFYFKQAAIKSFNEELFTLYGGLISVTVISVCFFVYGETFAGFGLGAACAFVGGIIAASTNIMKVQALRHIVATIYYPLFKLLAPLLAIIAGVSFFKETFSLMEWLGMVLGLLVPLLLITKVENNRQQNLIAGLLLVVITGVTSASSAVLNKYATDIDISILNILICSSVGICVGTSSLLLAKRGLRGTWKMMEADTTLVLLRGSFLRSFFIITSVGFMLLAYTLGGELGIVQTIHSMYILIPIVLAIYFYNEHWNTQKAFAVVLSIVALAFFH